MPKVIPILDSDSNLQINPDFLKGKRHLTPQEIYKLIQNRNTSSDSDWQNVYVSELDGEFDPELVNQSNFVGFVVLGRITKAKLKYHDLELTCGIYRSVLCNSIIGDDCVIHNVSYLSNYKIANRVMLFNIQEISCTNHSKFGEGVLKEGEEEKKRIWINVANENENRSVLAFEEMIAADAFLWSRYREDKELMNRFIELTENGKSKKLDTMGFIDDDAVIKNSSIIKDVKIGKCAYVKGALKLKNITILSSEDEPTQIGEGVEMVNGILGYGCHVFYQAIAVRFVIGRNCQLKYGARLLNSVLGDNSTVSCCELLNNLIFPFHEQHHNSSFLIASTIMGQSNIASNATIGSNHNSRSPDCEMMAGRGFWPGLCTDFKFDSRFASFVLIAKGSYQFELNITYPFSMISNSKDDNQVHIIPAYWFMYNMFAIVRNKYKFKSRDKRFIKVQNIETNPIAPDTIQEIESALNRIIELTSNYLLSSESECLERTHKNTNPEILQEFRKKISSLTDKNEILQTAKDYLHQNPSSNYVLFDPLCQKKFGAYIYHAPQAYAEYRRILKYFVAETFIEYSKLHNIEHFSRKTIEELYKLPLYTKWLNVGGQLIPAEKIEELFSLIKSHKIENWNQVHEFYSDCENHYVEYKCRYALYIMEVLYSRKLNEFTTENTNDLVEDVKSVAQRMLDESFRSREKDFTDFYRTLTYRNNEEKVAVLGELEDNSFLKDLSVNTFDFCNQVDALFTNIK